MGDLEIYERHVRHLIAALPRDGSTVDLSPLFFRLTIDSATEFLFGESTDTLSSGSSKGFAEAFDGAQAYTVNLARFGKVANLFQDRKGFNKDREFVHAFVDRYVESGLKRRDQSSGESEKGTAEGYIFLDELAKQTSDAEQIRSELLNILLAGRDTTGQCHHNYLHQPL